MVSLALDRDSPDESQTGVNIRAFPAFPQDSREVRTATGASGSPNGGRGADLAIFPGIWTHSSRRALERMTIERLTLALVARRLSGGVPLRFRERDNIFIRCEAKWAERSAYGVCDIGRSHMPIMFFNHARV